MKALITQHFLTDSRSFGDRGQVTSETRPLRIIVEGESFIFRESHYNAPQEVLILVWTSDGANPSTPGGQHGA